MADGGSEPKDTKNGSRELSGHRQGVQGETSEQTQYGTYQGNPNQISHQQILSLIVFGPSGTHTTAVLLNAALLTISDSRSGDNREKEQISLDNCPVFVYTGSSIRRS